MQTYMKNWFKYSIGFVICLLIRLIPFRPPNVEPILATQMPFSQAYGPWAGFTFAFMSIVLYDIITGTSGVWTLVVASTYGVLGLSAAWYFKKPKITRWNYVWFAFLGTIFFDAVTGLSIGPLFFGQSFSEAFFGQIPFTVWHLVGNMGFAFILSPALYSFVIKNEKLDSRSILALLKYKNS